MDSLLHITKRWLQPEWRPVTEVIERLLMDWFLWALLPLEHISMGTRGVDTPQEMIESLECAWTVGIQPRGLLHLASPLTRPRLLQEEELHRQPSYL